MDRISKWAVAGSLAWLVVAFGLILGTHGSAAFGAPAIESKDTSSNAAWSVMAPAEMQGGDTYGFERC